MNPVGENGPEMFTTELEADIRASVGCANDPCEASGCPIHDPESAA